MSRRSLLQRETRQTRPYRTAGQEAILSVLKTADQLRRKISAVVGVAGVTAQQYNVLRILRGAGREGLPTLSVGQRMVEHAPGITGLIDRLEKKGLVVRERTPGDRRVVTCRITPLGRELLAQLDDPVDALDDTALSALSEREQRVLIRLLEKVRSRCYGE